MILLRASGPKHQRGVTIVIAMLFLLILSIFAVSSFNSGTTNTRVTGNMIARQEAQASAQLLIDRTLSSAEFATDPSAAAADPLTVDMNSDGVLDYTAQLVPAPVCHRLRTVKNQELDADSDLDLPCLTGAGPPAKDSDGVDPTADDSACANTEWNVRAVATDPESGVSVAVNQGVGVRSDKTRAENLCL